MANRKTVATLLVTTLGFGFLIWLGFASVPRASAIPAFARKYQTSCTTCHNNYPELNDFGEAFKKNGFKFPKDDEIFVKEPPVLLGAKAQKEAFPKAVYPGEIPGSLPLGFRYSGFAQYNSKQPLSLGPPFVPRTDLFVPNTFTIIAAGSFGPTLSFWIDNDISSGGSNAAAGLGDGYLKVNDISHYLHLPKDSLNLRFGQFELDLPFTQARSVNLTSYDIYSEASISLAPPLGSTNNPFVFGIPQRGIEIGGYPNDGNFTWSLAVVNGNNSMPAVRNSKDIYIRISQRFNLERDPKVRREIQAAGPTGPRDHTSVRLGGFYYYGRNALNIFNDLFPGLGTLHEPFYRVGGDVRFKYRNWELYGLGMYGHDTNVVANATGTGFAPAPAVSFTGGFAESEYWIYPWLIGLMRYDFVNSPTDVLTTPSPTPFVPTRATTRNRLSPGLQLFLRANLKAEFEYQRRWERPFVSPVTGATQFFRANGFVSGVDFVF